MARAEHERCDQYEYTSGRMKPPSDHPAHQGRSALHGSNPGLEVSAATIRAEQTAMQMNKTRHFIRSQFPGAK